MKLRYLVSVAAMAPLVFAVPAIAQSEQTPQTAGQLAARYAACLVAERPSVADIYLAAAPGSPERTYAFNALAPAENNDCASFAVAPDGQQLQIPETILAGHIAEARYLVRFPGGPPPLIASSTPVATSDQEFAERLGTAEDPALEFPRVFGDCIVRMRALDVDRLVRTQPGSDNETQALGVLQPSLGSCLWSGQTLQFSRETLRAALTDALYRRGLSSAPRSAGAATEERDGQ